MGALTLYTVSFLESGTKNKKVADDVSGLTYVQVEKLLRKLEESHPCSHKGPCKFPFKNCDGGAPVVVVTKEDWQK